MRVLAGFALSVGLLCGPPASAQTSPPPANAVDPDQAAQQATIRKLNAYVELLNRTLRASELLDRYASWVNMKTGPTGRERIIYGLYSLYDVRELIAKAQAQTIAEPAMPELDAAMKDYIPAYAALSPAINEADAYYERQDYKSDKMVEGKALHARIAAAMGPFLTTRARADAAFKEEKKKSDRLELAALEKRDGRKARWHVRNVMIAAQDIVDRLPSRREPKVDMAVFDGSLNTYAAAVREMDNFGRDNPNSFFVFESQPRSLLGKLREFRDKLARAKGDARRASGDLTWIVNDYNRMVSSSTSATQFSR